jgi:hypothetical protein
MPSSSGNNLASTPAATAAQAESREVVQRTEFSGARQRPEAYPADAYVLGEGLTRAERMSPYERNSSDPVYRPLRIFTRDPATSALAGAVSLVNLPWEPLQPGPEGALFRVEGPEPPLDLNGSELLISSGLAPTMSAAQFRKQMVYAVCTSVYGSFRAALGRHVAWGFDSPGNGPLKLTVRPDAFAAENAY